MALTYYPKYKDSSVPWLEKVPQHWEVRRLGDSVLGCVNGVWGSEPDGVDDLPCVRVADFDRHCLRVRRPIPTIRSIAPNERRRRVLQSGDLLLEKSGGGDQQPVGVVILFDHDVPAVCSNFVARMTARKNFDSVFLTFLHSALYSLKLNTRSIKQTTGIQNLDSAAYLGESVAFPPLPEQTAIVRYLDYVDRRVRRFVRAKEKLIGLLDEQKQVIIHRAVTRGLDPDVPLKSSGVEWLGDVPKHWEVLPLKHWVKINDSVLPENTNADFEFDYLDIGSVGTGILVQKPQQIKFGAAPSRARRIVSNGDTIVSTVRTYLKAVWHVDDAGGDLVVSTGFAVLTPRHSTLPKFVSYLAQSNSFTDRVTAESIGIAYPAIAESRLGTFHVSLPPLPEQTAIVEYLDKATADIDTAITRARREVELLNEYRTRLIADVVTGKLDVREAAARLPDEAGEPEPP